MSHKQGGHAIDEQGDVRITGRVNDVIIRKGDNVFRRGRSPTRVGRDAELHQLCHSSAAQGEMVNASEPTVVNTW